jgi:hypothetical protein
LRKRIYVPWSKEDKIFLYEPDKRLLKTLSLGVAASPETLGKGIILPQ